MNLKLLAKYLGTVCMIIGLAMAFSLPWALPSWGQRFDVDSTKEFEYGGFMGLCISIVVCLTTASIFSWIGRNAQGSLYRKEAMAVVGLSWVLATLLGGLPYRLCPTYRSASVRLFHDSTKAQVHAFHRSTWGQWQNKPALSEQLHPLISRLVEAGAKGIPSQQFLESFPNGEKLLRDLVADDDWQNCILFPSQESTSGSDRRESHFRLRWVRVSIVDALFESQSGFSTTGATVFSDLEDPKLLPHCLLFWRSSTQFLGGLGIIVLFVLLLGHGSAGKAMMRAEITGPTKDSSQSRMQHTAWLFASVYCGLNLLLTVILKWCGLTTFDSLCHAFATMATGGFSTYNASIAHFNRPLIEYILVGFMILAGTNFTLLYAALIRQQWVRVFQDVEWRTYIGIILGATLSVLIFGLAHQDFPSFLESIRFSLFQVVSIMTTTGFATHDFDLWNDFGRSVLFILMFVGGCAGSTGGGLKVIRHVLFVKILRLELEQSFRPNVVRSLSLSGVPIQERDLRKNTVVYFGFVLILLVGSWLFLLTVEPDTTWGVSHDHKLIDCASAISANLNNIGPGLGTVGATQNYGHFSWTAKILFVWLMMLGRVEIFAILVLFVPGFWKSR